MDKLSPAQITVCLALSSYQSWSTVLDFAHPVVKTATLAPLGKAGRTTSVQPAAPGLPVLSASGQDGAQPQGSTLKHIQLLSIRPVIAYYFWWNKYFPSFSAI